MPSAPGIEIALLDADPDLLDVIPARDRDEARRRLRTPAIELPEGPFEARDVLRGPGAALIVEGVVARDLSLHGHLGTTLLGPGDLLPAAPPEQPAFVRGAVRWSAVEPALIAVLDERFHLAARTWPAVAAELVGRGAEQAARLAAQQAIDRKSVV